MTAKLKDFKWLIPEGIITAATDAPAGFVTGVLLTRYLLWYDEKTQNYPVVTG